MINPFYFPDRPQERSPDPGPFKRHRGYKPYLRVEFRQKCVYCRIPDTLKDEAYFSVDHYLPQSFAPDLANSWPNLFYACIRCNRRKGKFVATPALFIPNPCDHSMADHLQFRQGTVEGYTASGRFSIDQLLLSARKLQKYREFVIRTIQEKFEECESRLSELARIQELIAASDSFDEQNLLEADLAGLLEDIQALESDLEILTGEPISFVSTDDSEP